jgi:hypothetical protein
MVLFSQGQEENLILKLAYFENYIGLDDWQCRYIQDRCCYVCRTKESRKTRAFWGISWHQKMYNTTDKMLHKPRSLYPRSLYPSSTVFMNLK